MNRGKLKLLLTGIIVMLLSFICTLSSGQLKVTDTVYYNNHWQICEKPIAFYYRVGILATLDYKWYFVGTIKDYTIKNELLVEGSYSMEGLREGVFKFYYADGKPRLLAVYANGIATGDLQWFHHNGIVNAIINFPEDPQNFKIIRFTDEKGITTLEEGTGNFNWPTADFESTSNHYNVTGSFKYGIRDGDWIFNMVNSLMANSTAFKEVYKEGKRTKTVVNIHGGGTINSNLPTTIFSFSPRHLYTVESMKHDVLFSINGDSLTFLNIATYLIEHKPTEISLKYIVFDTAFNRVLTKLDRFISGMMFSREINEVDCTIEFKIGSKGHFENISFNGIGVDSLTKKYVEFFLAKFSDLEMPGDLNIAMEQNFKIYLYSIDLEPWLPASMSRGNTKKLFMSFQPREKMLKYLNDNKQKIKNGLIDNLLNNENYYYRKRK